MFIRQLSLRVMSAACISLLALPSVFAANAPATTGFVQRTLRDTDGLHRYMVFVPPNYQSRKRWPVVLFLHGAGERGTDGLRQTTVGLGSVIRHNPKSFPFVVVFPQCESLQGRLLTSWNADSVDGKRALAILKDVESQYRVDPKRRILTGWSMGGYGVWSLAAARPAFWSAVVPLSGGGDVAIAKRLKTIPVWAFHGQQDGIVLSRATQAMVAAVQAANGNAHFTLVKGIGHDVWKTAYSYQPLLDWMQNPKKHVSRPGEITATETQKAIRRNGELVPFIPAVQISRAVTLRVGNRVLESLSYSVPQMVKKSLLSGKIADIEDQVEADGRTFNLQFIGIRYSASLAKARIRTVTGGRLRVQFGLQNVKLRISKTYLTGRRRWAATGPIDITIGQKRPVWLTIDLQPYVAKRTLKFRTHAKSFQISDDNWTVTPPARLEVHGWGMTKKRVSNGLVTGLRERKKQIEQNVLTMVPKVVREIEKQLAVPDSMAPIAGLWPLPVYRPRLQIWPESAVAEDNGLTLSFGLTAAAIDPSRAPKSPRRVNGAGTSPVRLKNRDGLTVAISGEILPALTQLLIDADVAQLNVLDIPASPFADFVDPAVMTAVLPDLKRFGSELRVSTELLFRKPLAVVSRSDEVRGSLSKSSRKKPDRSDSPGSDLSRGAAFEIREGVLAVSIKPSPSAKNWIPYAEFSVRLSHPLKIGILKSGFTQRSVHVEWKAEPTVTIRGRFRKGVQPKDATMNADRLAEIFTRGWKTWTDSFTRSNPHVPDIAFGKLPLRMERLNWESQHLVAEFAVPGIKLSNRTETVLSYEVKGPYSAWGGPYRLEPGRSHEFQVPYSIIYRRRTSRGYASYTLPAGSHSEFRRPRLDEGGMTQLFLAK